MSCNMRLEAFPEVPITEADVAAFAAKLEAWYETLPPSEQAVLERLLDCAEVMALEECDVAGYAIPAIGARLARILAAGLMTASLAAPLAASAAPSFSVPSSALVAQISQPPEPVILAKAIALGADFTGSALSGLETVPNGFRIRYQNCDIYYSDAIGVHEVHGDIRTKYNTHRGPFGSLGLPATDEQKCSDGIGRYSQFSNNASIYWTPNTGPFEIGGIIRNQWVVQGAETSRFGYPTSELQSANGGQWIDFQNDVIYLEGTLEKASENVEMSRAQLDKWLLGFIEAGIANSPWEPVVIESFTIGSVSDTGYGFSQSRNRRVTVHIEGKLVRSLHADPHYSMDLELLFFAQKEADGSTSLRMLLVNDFQKSLAVDHNHNRESDLHFADSIASGFFRDGVVSPVKVIDLTIPAAVPVLSFKVMEDGRIKLFLQPGGGAPLVVQAVHFAFDRLAQ